MQLLQLRENPPAWVEQVVRDVHVGQVQMTAEKQVERALLETRAVAFALQRLGVLIRPDLGWRCARLGEAIERALGESFGELVL